MQKKFKKLTLITLLLVLLLQLIIPGSFAGPESPVYVLKVEGPIVPVVADYIQDGIQAAEAQGAACVILELNTPGGLYSTTQKIVESILNSKVPVVVYVSPAGAWAASAGTFITLSAHVAVMSPGSRIGAAHPVTMGGSDGAVDTHEQKAASDAAAWMRSLAQLKGRDPVNAELTVLESKSFSDKEALESNLIDMTAASFNELLDKIQGLEVTLINDEKAIIDVSGSPVKNIDMGSIQRLLFAVSEPNIAYLLMTVGTIGIIVELYNPGAIFPGVLGGFSLLLGLYALGSLNAQLSGVLLLLLGLALMAAEVFVVSQGLLAVGGIASFTMGSLMLFSRGSPAFMKVSLPLITGTVLVLTVFLIVMLRAVIRAHRRQSVSGGESVSGKTALAITSINPAGTVLFEGERWRAESTDDIEPGEKVKVVGFEGLTLKVKRM